MRLWITEVVRFASRRAVGVLLLVTVALAGLLAASAAYATRPADATERAAAEQLLREQGRGEEYARCVADPAAQLGPGATLADCETLRPELSWFLPRPDLDLAHVLTGRGQVVMVLLAGVGILVGATFAGADWASRSMSTQLLVEPRRIRVWLAKGTAVTAATTAAAAVVLAGFWGALAAVAAARGLAVTEETWRAVLEASGRSAVLVAAVTLGSFALTMALRHTVATLGLLFGYAVIGEGLVAALPLREMSRWSLPHNLLAWLRDGTAVRDPSLCEGVRGPCSTWYELSSSHAAAYLGTLLVLAVVVSVVTFRRRDLP